MYLFIHTYSSIPTHTHLIYTSHITYLHTRGIVRRCKHNLLFRYLHTYLYIHIYLYSYTCPPYITHLTYPIPTPTYTYTHIHAQEGFWEDVNIAHCLKVSGGILPHDTRDKNDRERFHPFTPGQHLEYRIPKGVFVYVIYLLYFVCGRFFFYCFFLFICFCFVSLLFFVFLLIFLW